jgi:hypothetical protein
MAGLAVLTLARGAIIVARGWPHKADASAHEWWLIVDHAGLAIALAACLFVFGRVVRYLLAKE